MLRERPNEGALLDALLEKTSRTFALSIPHLPEPTRREVTVAYLLFRIADTLEDATRWSGTRRGAELARFAELLERPGEEGARALADDWTREPPLEHPGYLELLGETPAVVAAFRRLRREARSIVRRHTLRTVERMARFVRRAEDGAALRLDDVADLRDYCYAVAGIVGEMLTDLFLLGRASLEPVAGSLRARAARFGEALQLVNILKDTATDRSEGRTFVPERIDRGEVFRLARNDLDEAGAYVRELQRAQAPRGLVAFTALPVLLARETLDRVEADGPGAKLTRPRVAEIAVALERDLERGAPAVAVERSCT